MCARGDLPAKKAGRVWMVPEWAIDEYVPRHHGESQGPQTGNATDHHLELGQAARVGLRGIEGGRRQVRGQTTARASGSRGRPKSRAAILDSLRGIRAAR